MTCENGIKITNAPCFTVFFMFEYILSAHPFHIRYPKWPQTLLKYRIPFKVNVWGIPPRTDIVLVSAHILYDEITRVE